MITLLVSVSAVVLAYPLAYFLAFVARRHRYTLLLVLLAPFFTSYLLRVYAWSVILPGHGTLNSVLESAGLVDSDHPLTFFYHSKFAIGLVLAYSWIPFVALPIFVVLDNLDVRLMEAAQDLGANRFVTFLRVTLPLSLTGVIAAFVFVLIPTTGEYITPLSGRGSGRQHVRQLHLRRFRDQQPLELRLRVVAVADVCGAGTGSPVSPVPDRRPAR